MDILTPQHPLWEAFVARLEAALDQHGCDDLPDKSLSRAILEALNRSIAARKADGAQADGTQAGKTQGDDDFIEAVFRYAAQGPGAPIDVEATLRWFKEHDGYCDCEVLYHVVGKYEERVMALE